MNFFKKYGTRIIVILITIILIIIIGFTSGGRSSVSKVEDVISKGLRPINKFFYSIGEKSGGFIDSLKNISTLKSENESLKKEITTLKEENRNYKNIVGQKSYLKAEFDLLNSQKYNLISSEIIGKESSNWFNRFTIDKGLNDGLKNGDTVVQAIEGVNGLVTEGVVGRIVDIGSTTSKITSIIDENSSISFKVTRTQDGGIISGKKDGKMAGFMFDEKADVKVGDEIYSSGLGKVYKKDLFIGKVTKVIEKDEELMKTIEVEPAINFKKLYRVFVISSER